MISDPVPHADEHLMDVTQVAEMLAMSDRWVYDRAKHDLPHVRLGRYIRFRRSDVSAFVQDHLEMR